MFVRIYIIVSFLRQYFDIIIYALHRIAISLEDKCRDQLWSFFNIYYFDYISLSFMYGQQITFQCVIIIFIGTSHSTIAIIFSSIHFDASYIYQLPVFDEYTRHSLLFAMRFRNLRSNVIIVIFDRKIPMSNRTSIFRRRYKRCFKIFLCSNPFALVLLKFN